MANKTFFAEKSSNKFAISIRVTTIEKPQNHKKESNFKFKITVQTTEVQWSLDRSMKEFEIFHSNLIVNDAFRGVNLPRLPTSKRSPSSMDEYITQKRNEYTQYLSEICHRSILLGCKDILDFIQAPEKVRRCAKKVMEGEMSPAKAGQMKKEGEKWKGYRSRYFVLLPNYLLQYFENADAYQIGIHPKGSIDLTLATKILVYDKTSNPYSMGIKTPTRIWKLQCDTESERDEWVNSLRNLLQNPSHTGYILDFNDYMRSNTRMNGAHSEDTKEEGDVHSQDTDDDDDDISDAQTDNANGYKQQLDIQRETMVKWKEKIQELSEEIVNIEQERHETDKEYEIRINEMKQINIEITKKVNEKDDIISATQEEMKLMSQSMAKEAKYRENKELSMNAILYKVQGDSVSKLKYNKQSNKFVVFVAGINHLFYYDVNGAKDQKYIVVKDISINDNSIQKSINKPWFLIIGHKRSALFASDSQQTRDEWYEFINKSVHLHGDSDNGTAEDELESKMSAATDDNDDANDDQKTKDD
eukprot:462677_1